MPNVLTSLTSALGKILPEGRFKEFLRSSYYRSPFNGYASGLVALSRIVTGAKVLSDNSLFVELNNSLKFYAPRDREAYPPLVYSAKYGKQNQLVSIKGIEYFWGLFAVLREVFVDNIYEQHHQPKEGDIVIDAGAHIGIYAVRAAKAVVPGKGLVTAIEPDDHNVKFLQKNIAANDLTNVVIVQKGVWSEAGKLKLYSGNYSMTPSFYLQEWQVKESTEVEVDTLDNIIEGLGIRRVDFIKMDVEGAELEALKGMKETLRSNVKLAISAYHEQDGKATYKTIVPWLKSKRFRVHEESGIVYAARE
jgi:FkbM family methyltransferase